jgi:predicted chitinase
MADEVKKISRGQDGLNPLSNNNPRSHIDLKTSTVQGALRKIVNDYYKDDVFEGVTEFYGQILRVIEDPKDRGTPYLSSFFNVLGVTAKSYKVRVFDIDSTKPVPDTFDETKADRAIIDLYNEAFYEDTTSEQPLSVGDFVKVTYGNLTTLEDCQIISPIKNATSAQGSTTTGEGSAASTAKPAAAFSGDTSPLPTGPIIFDPNQKAADAPGWKSLTPGSNAHKVAQACKEIGMRPEQIIAILGVVSKESNFIGKKETGYSKTSVERTRAIFGGWQLKGQPDSFIQDIKSTDEKFFNFMYDQRRFKKLGNGNLSDGDGYKYLGRGFNGITGKAIYKIAADRIKIDIVSDSKLLEDSDVAAKACAAYFDINGKRLAGVKKMDISAASQHELNMLYVAANGGSWKFLKTGSQVSIEAMTKTEAYVARFLGIMQPPLPPYSAPTGAPAPARKKSNGKP